MQTWKRSFESPSVDAVQRELLNAGSEASFEVKKSAGSRRGSTGQLASPRSEGKAATMAFADRESSGLKTLAINLHARTKSLCGGLAYQPDFQDEAKVRRETNDLGHSSPLKEKIRGNLSRSAAMKNLIRKYLPDDLEGYLAGQNLKNLRPDWPSRLMEIEQENNDGQVNFNLRRVKGPIEVTLETSKERYAPQFRLGSISLGTDKDSFSHLRKEIRQGETNSGLVDLLNKRMSIGKDHLQKLASRVRQSGQDGGPESTRKLNSYVTMRHRDTKSIDNNSALPSQLSKNTVDPSVSPGTRMPNDIIDIITDENTQVKKALPSESLSKNTSNSSTIGLTIQKLMNKDFATVKNAAGLDLHSRRPNLVFSEMRQFKNKEAIKSKTGESKPTHQIKDFCADDQKGESHIGVESLSGNNLALSKGVITESLRQLINKKQEAVIDYSSFSVKQEFDFINQKIEKMFTYITKENEYAPSTMLNREAQSSDRIKRPSASPLKQEPVPRDSPRKTTKSIHQVSATKIARPQGPKERSLSRKIRTTAASPVVVKRATTSVSRSRGLPIGVNTSIKAVGVKMLTIKNIILNKSPSPSPAKQVNFSQIKALKPPKASRRSFLNSQRLSPNLNHHVRVKSLLLKSSDHMESDIALSSFTSKNK